MPVSLTIDPYRRLLLTVVSGPLLPDDPRTYADTLLARSDLGYVERHLVDARPMLGDAGDLAELLAVHRDMPLRSRRRARRAILAAGGPYAQGTGPALGRALVVHHDPTVRAVIAYRVFRDPASAERFLGLGSGRPAPRL